MSIVLGGVVLAVTTACSSAPPPTESEAVAVPASYTFASESAAPAGSRTAAMPQEPRYPTDVQDKFGLPDIQRPREKTRAQIGVYYEAVEFDVELDAPTLGPVAAETERERVGLRLGYGPDHLRFYFDVFYEEFGKDSDIALWGSGLGFDGLVPWIPIGDDASLAWDYGLFGSYHFGKDTPDGATGDIGVYYADVDARVGLGFDFDFGHITGGYRMQWIPWGTAGADLSFSDSFDNGTLFDAMNSSGYVRAALDLEPIYVSGEYMAGDLEGFWVNVAAIW